MRHDCPMAGCHASQVSLHGVTVADGVLIGMGSTLLEGVKVQTAWR